ncbi:Nramp family divalent metal transporter [Rouxiella badensis]|nr:Nramp family divalent metal transporter [Rouxiella badensis]WAT10189.1 Nramp family divalent metal transporter [Rouxiella badensis]
MSKNSTLTERTNEAIGEALSGRKRGMMTPLLFVGPAVIASIAYMDPGNFATNIQAGSKFGYSLLWVVVMANLIAMLFQALSAKLGIVTRKNLAEMCRDQLPPPVVWGMWAVSEIAAMATDLAEFLGGALALSLLFSMPLLAGMGVTAVITYALLMVEKRGFRPVELMIGGLVAVIALCYLVQMFIVPVLGGRRDGDAGPQIAQRRGADHFCRYYWGDRDAARHFSTFRADAASNVG